MNKKKLVCLIDASALKSIIEGKNEGKSKDLLDQVYKNRDEDFGQTFITPLACLLRAIYTADPKSNIKELQRLISVVKVMPSFADFKDTKAVMEEVLKVAQMVGGKVEKKSDVGMDL